jgi:3-dehydroquinate synthase
MKVDINFEAKSAADYSIYIDELENLTLSGKVAIITNPKVAGFHLKDLIEKVSADELFIITVPDGEEYKNQQTIDLILENLFNHKFNRNATLIAFGGGVIGDMTGFAASIYQRGVNFIQVPTTLLSQVDASVGGKTGINNKYGKNLIGAFYQPKAVYIQSKYLDTLPNREFGAGVAEIVKMAVTFDKDFFEWLESADLKKREDLQLAIKKSVETKASVVAQDEKEKGLRAVLNYGHTFAHVVENLTHYKKYLHGEAVAIGICMANDLSVALGILSNEESQRIKELLLRYDLPVTYNIEDIEEFYEHFFLDKKAENKKIKFILAKGLGAHFVTDEIEKSFVLDILKEYAV